MFIASICWSDHTVNHYYFHKEENAINCCDNFKFAFGNQVELTYVMYRIPDYKNQNDFKFED